LLCNWLSTPSLGITALILETGLRFGEAYALRSFNSLSRDHIAKFVEDKAVHAVITFNSLSRDHLRTKLKS
jgi:hypothetical protein